MKIKHGDKEIELTGEDLHYGAMAHAAYKEGINPPSWVEDEDVWEKAKDAALKTYDLDDESFWPATVSIYENMGGEVGGGEKEARALSKTCGALAAKRMGKNKALMASVKANGYSLNDLQEEVHEELQEHPLFRAAGGMGCFVADIVCPEHEQGEEWEAIVCLGSCLYCVTFKIDGDHEIEIVGDPKEVERTTDYEYVNDMETEARRAVKAGQFKGNQHKSPKEVAAETTLAARTASRHANRASVEAENAEDSEAKGAHDRAAALHMAAHHLHASAAELHGRLGNDEAQEQHETKATMHKAKAEHHSESMGHTMMARNAVSIDCASKSSNDMRTILPTEDGLLMYMPAGLHTITPSQDGRPVTVTIMVDASAADVLEKQRAALDAAGKKPFFSVQHDTEIAAFWPSKFFWDKKIDATGSLAEGIWVEGEWTKSGREAVEGKDFRTFSPTFFVDAIRNDEENPCKVVCNEDARANMGALENDPAFQEISPLWARSAAGAQSTGKTGDNMTEQEKAALQARNTQLEHKVAELKAKDDQVSKAELRAATAELAEIKAKMEVVAMKEKVTAAEQIEAQRRQSDADQAVTRMIEAQRIPALDREAQDDYRKRFIADPTLIPLLAGKAAAIINDPIQSRVTTTGNGLQIEARDGLLIEGGFSVPGAVKKYCELMVANNNVHLDPDNITDAYRKKGNFAMQAAALFKSDLQPNLAKWEHLPITQLGRCIGLKAKSGPLTAADYTDPGSTSTALGVLSGTLVLQRTLPFFAYKYPELMSIYTDFGDTPGLFNQTETTRIVSQQAVQSYNNALDSTGRPQGWSTVSKAVTTDVSITLNNYIAVPIVFSNNTLGSTTRRLFDEQAVLAIKAMAGNMVSTVTTLITAANYNSYAATGSGVTFVGPVNGVPYPYYAKDLSSFAMGDLDTIDSIFTVGKVPEEERGVWLNPSYYAKLRGDPRLSFFYFASGGTTVASAGDFITEAKLPKLSGFAPYKSPYLPATNNLVGFAYQKAAAIVKSRLPQDFSQALGVMIPGSVTTVTDPDTKFSLMLVQYVNLTGNYAEWRPEVMFGAAVGDARAGLLITSQ